MQLVSNFTRRLASNGSPTFVDYAEVRTVWERLIKQEEYLAGSRVRFEWLKDHHTEQLLADDCQLELFDGNAQKRGIT